MDATKGAETA